MNNYEKNIFDLYDKLNIGKSNICNECIKQYTNLSKPVSIWQVGNEYYNSKYKILFVGKVARGNLGEKYNNFLDATNIANELYNNKKWAYWSYTKAIIEEIYNENSWEKIAFTNMVKCNNSETIDKTKECLKNNCLHILKEEIKILEPKNIIFYTGKYYDNQIKNIFNIIKSELKENVFIGKKKMEVLRFKGIINENSINCIRVNHPERMKKLDYINYIIKNIV